LIIVSTCYIGVRLVKGFWMKKGKIEGLAMGKGK
jgi:hypothetical protein